MFYSFLIFFLYSNNFEGSKFKFEKKKMKLLLDQGLMLAMIHPEAKILWLSCKPFENVAYNGSADTL